MKIAPRISRVGFAVVKLKIDRRPWFLMRRNLKWGDISFIGGHEQARDNGSLMRAARRELEEEAPAFRTFRSLTLEPIIAELQHGPVYSMSAKTDVLYTFGFFLVKFTADPSPILQSLGKRTLNVFVSQDDLLREQSHASALVRLLNDATPVGLDGLPFSWEADLATDPDSVAHSPIAQKQLHL